MGLVSHHDGAAHGQALEKLQILGKVPGYCATITDYPVLGHGHDDRHFRQEWLNCDVIILLHLRKITLLALEIK